MKIAMLLNQNEKTNHVNTTYIDLLFGAGLVPIIVPFPTRELSFTKPIDFEYVKQYLEGVDGLLLTGGADIDPTLFDEENYASMNVDSLRDFLEMYLLNLMVAENKKVFGICRGFQMICKFLSNKLFRFSYRQDLGDHPINGVNKLDRNVRIHSVYATMDKLYGGKGIRKIWVNSMHHQGIVISSLDYSGNEEFLLKKEPRITAITDYSEQKGNRYFLVEGINIDNMIGGVQWHPEEMKDCSLLNHFFLGK